jgi:hypothetical protein
MKELQRLFSKLNSRLEKRPTVKLLLLGGGVLALGVGALLIASMFGIINLQSITDTYNEGRLVYFDEFGTSEVIRVELADSEAEYKTGLMNRNYLPPDAGMLFVFENPQQLTFWMKDTYIPLDIIFLGENLRVISISEHTKPLQIAERYSSGGEAKYVLEVNAGWVDRTGLLVGDEFILN